MRPVEVAFWRFSSGKLFSDSRNILRKITTTESDLSKAVPVTLLKFLSVMVNFLKVFQDFTINSLQYKKHLLGVVSWSLQVAYIRQWWGCDFFLLMIVTKVQLLKNSQGHLSPEWIKVKWRSRSIKSISFSHFSHLSSRH